MTAVPDLPDYLGWQAMVELSLKYCDGKYWMEDILAGIYSGKMHLWHYVDAAGITWFEQYPRKKVLCMGFGGGNLETIKAALPDIAWFAREAGCQSLEIHGRTGWARALKDYGFEKTSETARLVL